MKGLPIRRGTNSKCGDAHKALEPRTHIGKRVIPCEADGASTRTRPVPTGGGSGGRSLSRARGLRACQHDQARQYESRRTETAYLNSGGQWPGAGPMLLTILRTSSAVSAVAGRASKSPTHTRRPVTTST